MMTVKQTADSLGVGPETVRRWIRARKLRGVSYGSDRAGWRVPASEVERFKREGPAQ
jgi:excisionase family DNA binding protein